jgi:hypothetical protein
MNMRIVLPVCAVCLLAIIVPAAPAPPKDEDLPAQIQYSLAIREASALGSILTAEMNARTEDRPTHQGIGPIRVRMLKPRLYTDRLEFLDGVLANPQKILKRDLTATERAALKAKRAEIDKAYQKAIERGEVERNPPKSLPGG